jgi:hypothetical protein
MMEWFLSRALIIVPRGLLARNGDNKNATERGDDLLLKMVQEKFCRILKKQNAV